MCTVTWLQEANGYQLLCNRDERHTRGPASAPLIQTRAGVAFVAPIDSSEGGTWLAANQFGLTLCLLNRYQACPSEPAQTYRSRGLLVLDLIAATTTEEVSRRLARIEQTPYQPFTLLGLQPGEASFLVEWTGQQLGLISPAEARRPLTSSSFETEQVIESRQRQFGQLVAAAGELNAELLYHYHRSHAPVRGAYSTCMHRPDAATVSFSWVKVTEAQIEFRYQGQAPCAGQAESKVVLPRLR